MKRQEHNKQTDQCSADDTENRIQRRAFELYSARGQESGHELEDWLEAEREVRHSGTERLVA
jgi:hypothetical protein